MDSNARWARIQDLFLRASELDPAEREVFLAQMSAADQTIKSEVASLLAYGDITESIIRGAVGSAGATGETRIEQGSRVGVYEVVRELGRGGMGAVFLAVRADDQYRKQVAIKLAHSGFFTSSLLDRFRVERQILANLEHPNIGRLLDGGEMPGGAPYVVMEYVEGVPIDEYCKQKQTSLRDRLKLFQQVCEAVAYAHRNLVVHRDIKPTNILVTTEAIPKLLDFGIARVLLADGSPQADVTIAADRRLTPAYASPEQIRGASNISTASDIYSLGILLYELLCGCRPYALEDIPSTEWGHLICETQPPAPSAAVAQLEPVNKKRAKELQGDLDTIVLMAIRKEPERRYISVEQFSDDIANYLNGFAVIARKDSAGYRTSKFVNRHRGAVIAAALFVLVIIGFAAGMAVLARRAQRERDTARAERTRAEQVASLLLDAFHLADPQQSNGDKVTAREILDRSSSRIQGQHLDAALRADLLDTLSPVYLNLNLLDSARKLGQQSLAIRRKLPVALSEDNDVRIGATLVNLASIDRHFSDYPSAEKHLREAIALYEQFPAASGGLGNAFKELAEFLSKQGRSKEAEPYAHRAVELIDRSYGAASAQAADALRTLGSVQIDEEQYARGEQSLLQSLTIFRQQQMAGENTIVADVVSRLGEVNYQLGHIPESHKYFAEALALYSKLIPGSQDEAMAENNLALAFEEEGDLAASEAMKRKAVATFQRLLPGSQDTADLYFNLGFVLHQRGNHSEDEEQWKKGFAIVQKVLKPGDDDYTRGIIFLALADLDHGRYAAAEAAARKAVEARRKEGASGIRLSSNLGVLGEALYGQGRVAEAESVFQEMLEINRKAFGDDHVYTAQTYNKLGRCAVRDGRREEADALFSKSIAVFRSKGEKRAVDLASALLAQGNLLLDEGRTGEALPRLREALKIRESVFSPDSFEVALVRNALGRAEHTSNAPPAALLSHSYLVECQAELEAVRRNH